MLVPEMCLSSNDYSTSGGTMGHPAPAFSILGKGFDLTLRAARPYAPCSPSHRSHSMADMQPVPAAVIAWR